MTDESTTLADWDATIQQALVDGDALRAVDLALAILPRFPQRVVTYQQMVHALWSLRRWQEGENWGRRLLQADPGNALAWRAVARAIEQRGERARAYATWQRAFEGDPYEPETRAGLARTNLARTSLKPTDIARLNLACLATLYLRGHRWPQAVDCCRTLIQAAPRRVDFAAHLVVALWQSGAQDEAYVTARRLVHDHPRLLLAWVVLDAVGDEDDKALANSPLSSMDPDGAYVRQWCNLRYPARPTAVTMDAGVAALLQPSPPDLTASGVEQPVQASVENDT